MVENRNHQQILNSKILGNHPEKTPLLVIHGLFGMLDNWATLGNLWAEERAVHLLDLRNHGKSFHAKVMDLPSMAEDILVYMDAQGITKADVIGHSLGGKVAMTFALKYPEKVDKLVVVDIAPKPYPAHHNAIFYALNSVPQGQLENRAEAEAILRQSIKEESVVQFLAKSLYRKEDKKLYFRFNLPVIIKEYQNFIGKDMDSGIFRGKTLFIGGGNSDYILPEDQNIIGKYFPDHRILYIRNAGHWVHAENPKDFFQAIEHFLG